MDFILSFTTVHRSTNWAIEGACVHQENNRASHSFESLSKAYLLSLKGQDKGGAVGLIALSSKYLSFCVPPLHIRGRSSDGRALA